MSRILLRAIVADILALELLDVVIRAVADATQAKAAKIDALKNFIEVCSFEHATF